MIVKKEMKKILLLISMTIFLTSCSTLLYMATDGKYGGRKPPEKDSPAYFKSESYFGKELKNYLDSILARKRETKIIMDGFEGKLPEGMAFVKGYPKQTRVFGYKNVVYLFDEKKQFVLP